MANLIRKGLDFIQFSGEDWSLRLMRRRLKSLGRG